MKFSMLLAGGAVLALAACAQPPASNVMPSATGTPRAGTPPVSNAGGSASGMPQSANSLPAGSRVNAPLVAPTGVIETTRVR